MDIEKLAMDYARVLAVEVNHAYGETDAFCEWLNQFMLPEEWIKSLEVPSRKPDAVTIDGWSEEVFRWYRFDDCVLGFYMPDGDIQLVIPDDAEPPSITDYWVPLVPLAIVAGGGGE